MCTRHFSSVHPWDALRLLREPLLLLLRPKNADYRPLARFADPICIVKPYRSTPRYLETPKQIGHWVITVGPPRASRWPQAMRPPTLDETVDPRAR